METLFIGRNLIFLPEVDSTNSYAMNLLKNVNLPEGTVVHTAYQTQGRGQRGSSWNAEPASNITASLILKPLFLNIKNHFFLYMISALACYDTMAEILNNSQFDIKIKWPNDILVNKKKIAGILIENNILNNQINACIVGIGINVNQTTFDTIIQATSIKLLTADIFPVNHVLDRFCYNFEKYYILLKNGKSDTIMENYMDHFFGLNTWMLFEIKNVVKLLMVRGVSERGLLVLQEENGDIIEVDVKEVKWLY